MLLGSSILELALGMVFFYFLLSILCSHINELIAGALNSRGKDLVKGVRDLLNHPPATGSTHRPTEELPEDVSETIKLIKRHLDRHELGELLLLHPLIQGLATQPILPWQRKRIADYIPAHTFSHALIGTLLEVAEFLQIRDRVRQQPADANPPVSSADTVAQIRSAIQQLPDGPRRALLPLVAGSAHTIEDVRANIENWYNAKMDRVSGVYKRRTQLWLLLIGLLATLTLNADSLAVVTALWHYPTLRQAIAEQARQTSTTDPTASPSAVAATSEPLRQIQQDVQNLLVFPIGWGSRCAYNRWNDVTIRSNPQSASITESGRIAPFDPPNCRPQSAPLDLSGWLLKVVGFVVTAAAISLGASFWFDLLRKVSNIRSSGPAPGEPSAVSPAQTPREV